MNLFTPIVPIGKLHPNFIHTCAPGAAGVREVLNRWNEEFVDRDGKFVREFQTTYNSCFWELYLFAVLKSFGVSVDFAFEAPDFVCAHLPLAIEATIASHAYDGTPEWQKTFKGITHDDLQGAYIQSITRLSNAFLGKEAKYRHSYSSLPFMAGRAYIIAIANFGTQDFNMLGDVAMQRLLYDVWDEREIFKPNGSPVPVGLFHSARFSHVSGVLYSSVATFGKARALSRDDGSFLFHAVRIKDNIEPIHILAKKGDYHESLTDGLRLFINPFADITIDTDLFKDPGVRVFLPDREGELLVSCHPDGDLCMRFVQNIIQR